MYKIKEEREGLEQIISTVFLLRKIYIIIVSVNANWHPHFLKVSVDFTITYTVGKIKLFTRLVLFIVTCVFNKIFRWRFIKKIFTKTTDQQTVKDMKKITNENLYIGVLTTVRMQALTFLELNVSFTYMFEINIDMKDYN